MFSSLGGGRRIFLPSACFTAFLLFCSFLPAVQINNMKLIDEVVLTEDGYSADIALHPTDGSLHVAWVNRFGDIEYAVKDHNGTWSHVSAIPDGGLFVFAREENTHDRKCMGLCIDYKGISHIVFSEVGGDLYYISGVPGLWNAPKRIVEKAPNTIYPDIVAVRDYLYVIYEDADTDKIYNVNRFFGSWSSPKMIATGEYPSLTVGNNRVYFLCRGGIYEASDFHRIKFAVVDAGENSWQFKSHMTDPEGRTGQGPGLAVFGGKIYLSWSMGIDNPDVEIKTQLFCAFSTEPGNSWTPRLGESVPDPYRVPYYENTGDPHSRVSVYSDGLVIEMNGGRNERFRIFENSTWSSLRSAPWNDGDNWGNKGIIQVVNDGRTAWVVNSLSNLSNGKVSVSGITNPNGQILNPPPPDAVDDLEILPKKVLTQSGYSGDLAVSPVDGQVYAAWVQNSGIQHALRAGNGVWSDAAAISTQGNLVGAKEGEWPRPCLALDVDGHGICHMVFSTENGDLFYMNNQTGTWSLPLKVVDSDGYLIYPDLVAWQNTLSVVYEKLPEQQICTVQARNGQWGEPVVMNEGSNPALAMGQEGRLYLTYRGMETHEDLHFAWCVPTFTDWVQSASIIVPDDQSGASPGMTVYQGKIYIAWNNDTDVEFSDFKSQIYCWLGDEPGVNWRNSKGSYGPIYAENTSDPHLRVSHYSDGQVLLLNGRRLESRFALYNGEIWSHTRTGPWKEGYPDVDTDGQIVWVIVGSNASANDEVSVTGIRYLEAEPFHTGDPVPVVDSDFDTLQAEVGQTLMFGGFDGLAGQPVSISRSSVTPALSGMSLDGAAYTFSWTPQSDQLNADPWGRGPGMHLFGVTLTTLQGKQETVYFWIRVVDVNQSPQITSAPETEIEMGALYTYSVTAEDPDGDAISFSLEMAPEGMTIDEISGQITWPTDVEDEGSHDVRVRATDARGDFDLQTFTVQVIDTTIPVPLVQFHAEPAEGIFPLEVQFVNESTGQITAYAWDFGDFNSGSEENPVHSYTSAGLYTVRLIANGPGGADTLTVPDMIRVLHPAPLAGFTVTPDSGGAPLTVQFTDASDNAIFSWLWDFGDGSQSTLQNPQHTYIEDGWYTVSLRVEGPGGIDSLTAGYAVQVGTSQPVADFTADTTWGYESLTVHFLNRSLGEIDEYLWDFGDGTQSTLPNPEHTYTQSGRFSVYLMVSGPGGTDSHTINEMIHVRLPVPTAGFFADTTMGEAPLTVRFTNSTDPPADTYHWDFGDGQTSMEMHPSHTFTDTGDYTVQLIASGSGGQDTLTVPAMIHVGSASGIDPERLIPVSFHFHPLTPNPFNPSTKISFDLPKSAQVFLTVYDLRGHRITVLKNEFMTSGFYSLTWDGTDEAGRTVPSGMYIITLNTGTIRAQRKAILMK
jgi:PKD repeat protein